MFRCFKKSLHESIEEADGIFKLKPDLHTCASVVEFYSQAPFPNYQGFETADDLDEITKKNVFLHDLKKFIGFDKSIIEVGSGTCQLSLALAHGSNNLVVALDPTFESLALGRKFAKDNGINNIVFFNADLFQDPIEENSFDFVWCSGVLHHTQNSEKGFETISRWAKPNGYIFVGLYNSIGRLRTNFRQLLYRLFGRSNFAKRLIEILDPYLRKNLSEEKKIAWFRDQYEHPIERKHSMDEVIRWFEKNDIMFLGSAPSLATQRSSIQTMNGYKGSILRRIFIQIKMLFSNLGAEGGLFIMVGKKKSSSCQCSSTTEDLIG